MSSRPSRVRSRPARFADAQAAERQAAAEESGRRFTKAKKKQRPRRSRDPLDPPGYALRLSEYRDYGRCGVPEAADDEAQRQAKVAELVTLIREAPHVVVHTGAGISTAAGIPDFRGVEGVWTRHQRGDPLPASERCWNNALPTLAHRALAALVADGTVACVVTQNIDGLHERSGLGPESLAELHGNIFKEACEGPRGCRRVFTRSFDVGGVGFRETGRTCPSCGEPLIDQLLDWEDSLPERDFDLASAQADLCAVDKGLAICLGTSMQMTPARDWPCKADRLVIVNLQPTVRDHVARLVVRAPIDAVMRGVMRELGKALPTYRRTERFLVKHSPAPAAASTSSSRFPRKRARQVDNDPLVELHVVDALGAPCGFLSAVTVTVLGEDAVRLERQPFCLQRRLSSAAEPRDMPHCHVTLDVEFERVPLGNGRFFRPAPQRVEYSMHAPDGQLAVAVDLTPPDAGEPPAETSAR